jgi:PST family polysaccharide transporter
LSFGAQIVLARLLLPEDFGLFGLAVMVSAFANLIRDAGLTQVLVQRQKEIHRWINPAFWMLATFGVIAACGMIGVSPTVARIYQSPQLVGLILVLAVASPINAVGVLPGTMLRIELRFRLLAILALAAPVLTFGLSVTFAALNFHAYSFVLPLALVEIGRTIYLWRISPVKVRRSPEWSKWKSLAGDSSLIFITSILITLTVQGDYMVLGWFQSTEVVGLYFFAFSLSTQAAKLLSTNLANVLFPTLTRLQAEPQRQVDAFLRATRLIALVTVPLCLLLAALAGPVVRLLFGVRWTASIPLLQILNIGMAVATVNFAGSLLQAQRRNVVYWWISVASVVIFFALVIPGTWLYSARGTAVAVAVHCIVITVVSLWIAIAPMNRGWRDIGRLFALPLAGGGLAIGVGAVLAALLPGMRGRDILAIAITLLASGVIYCPLIYFKAPDAWKELAGYLSAIVRGLRRAPAMAL